MILLHLLTEYEEVSNEGDTAEEEADLHLFSGDCGEEVSHMGAADGEQSVIGELWLDLGPLTLCSPIRWTNGCPNTLVGCCTRRVTPA